MFDLKEHPHRRYNPLTREWVLVSPHRTKRPWQGQVESVAAPAAPTYDPTCYLCSSNARAGGHRNPAYTGTFVFDNDFATLLPDTPAGRLDEGGLLVAESERGICRVVCFSPDHSLTVARMSREQMLGVVNIWAEQFAELIAKPFIGWVQIFENRGEMMGASNPHPHCQIWSTATVPNEARREQSGLGAYSAAHQSCLLCDYVALERRLGERVVASNDCFTALVPFWAVWPFEILVVAHRHVTGLDALTAAERTGLADILRQVATRYDNVFSAPFPYTMGFHQRPALGVGLDRWHLHAHYYPPLLRSASVRKFMVGYEMLGTPQRDITAEAAAARLRECSSVHYLDRLTPAD